MPTALLPVFPQDFLQKEFSEENILFWQACECFSHVPAHDKKELSYRAREIFSKFLCSKATTPVNIDSQAQLADDILNAPHPDMFKEQQLQVTLQTLFHGASSQGLRSRTQSSMCSSGEGPADNVGMVTNPSDHWAPVSKRFSRAEEQKGLCYR